MIAGRGKFALAALVDDFPEGGDAELEIGICLAEAIGTSEFVDGDAEGHEHTSKKKRLPHLQLPTKGARPEARRLVADGFRQCSNRGRAG